MRDAVKAAEKAGRFDDIGFDEISLRSENRDAQRLCGERPYETPSQVIRRATAELGYLQDRERDLEVLERIKRVYKK
jgi:hypothetical protein